MIALEPSVPEQALAAMRAPFLEREARPIDVPVMQPLPAARSVGRGHALSPVRGPGRTASTRPACARTSPFRWPWRTWPRAAQSAVYRYEGKAFRVAPPVRGVRRSSCRSAWRSWATIGPAPGTPNCWPWPGEPRRRAGGRDLWIELGDVSLFSAFVGRPGPGAVAGGAAQAGLPASALAARRT